MAFVNAPRSSLSKIEPHEEKMAKDLIDGQFRIVTGKGFDMHVAGYMIAAKIYVRPEELKEVTRADGTKVKLFLPQQALEHDKYQSVAALVCGMGPQCYDGKNIDGSPRFTGPWCKVGDWVVIPRYESFVFSYRGIAMAMFPDDKVLGVIDDPTDVAPGHMADKI
jgi:hypothetical protein